jgi:DnaA family protein
MPQPRLGSCHRAPAAGTFVDAVRRRGRAVLRDAADDALAYTASHVPRAPAVPELNAVRQIPLAIGPTPLQTLDGFVTGANAAVVAHLLALAGTLPRAGAQAMAPLYLWGPPGCGKTHLLRALAHAAQQHGLRAGWFDAASPAPWQFDPGWSLLMLDTCDALDDIQQQAAFAMFIEATTANVPIAAAGALPPIDLVLRDDLRTRLGWGHVFALEPLAETDSRAALRREADRRGIFLSDEVMDFLLTRFSRDLQHLMALLDRLDEFALSQQRAITVPLLKRMFEQEGAAL